MLKLMLLTAPEQHSLLNRCINVLTQKHYAFITRVISSGIILIQCQMFSLIIKEVARSQEV